MAALRVGRAALAGAALALAGCLHPASPLCENGGVCGPGMHCGIAGDVQLCVPATCGNGLLDPDEVCDDGNNLSGDGCPADCSAACGDGVLDPGEHCDDGNAIDGDGCDHNCTLTACGNGVVTDGEACDDGNAVDGDSCDTDCTTSALGQQAYVKASNSDYGDVLGTSVALSADGSTLAVGAPGESSADDEIDGLQADNSAPGAGAVYVFARRRATWRQQAYVKAPNSGAGDRFGCSVALSADGSMLVVGAVGEPSAATGIDGDPTSTAAAGAGAVYVFVRSAASWRQAAYVKPSNTGAGDGFGACVALSSDGAVLAASALGEASDGDPADNTAPGAGAVYVFVRSATSWREDAYLKASNADPADHFGCGLALSGDGQTLVVGAAGESSTAAGTGGNQANNLATAAGAAYVFTHSGARWIQQIYLKASNTDAGDQFGAQLALSGDGAQLAVAAPGEASAVTGIGGQQRDNTAADSGAVYLFARSGAAWHQQAYVKASNTGPDDAFGGSVALSADGTTLAVGGPGDDSVATGINGDPSESYAEASVGAVYVFH